MIYLIYKHNNVIVKAKEIGIPPRARAEVPAALAGARGAGREAEKGGEGTQSCESM